MLYIDKKFLMFFDLQSELKKLQFGDRDQTEETHTFVENVPDSKEVLLMDRLKMYEIAERNAKNVGDFSKVRRYLQKLFFW